MHGKTGLNRAKKALPYINLIKDVKRAVSLSGLVTIWSQAIAPAMAYARSASTR